MAWLLGGRDFHAENLRLSGGLLFFTDEEALLSAEVNELPTGAVDIIGELDFGSDNGLNSGILPRTIPSGHGSESRRGTGTSAFEAIEASYWGWSLALGRTPIRAELAWRFIRGYRETLDALAKTATSHALEYTIGEIFGEVTTRNILRATSEYQSVAGQAMVRAAQQGMPYAEAVREGLADRRVHPLLLDQGIVEAEVLALAVLDIPLFAVAASERSFRGFDSRYTLRSSALDVTQRRCRYLLRSGSGQLAQTALGSLDCYLHNLGDVTTLRSHVTGGARPPRGTVSASPDGLGPMHERRLLSSEQWREAGDPPTLPDHEWLLDHALRNAHTDRDGSFYWPEIRYNLPRGWHVAHGGHVLATGSLGMAVAMLLLGRSSDACRSFAADLEQQWQRRLCRGLEFAATGPDGLLGHFIAAALFASEGSLTAHEIIDVVLLELSGRLERRSPAVRGWELGAWAEAYASPLLRPVLANGPLDALRSLLEVAAPTPRSGDQARDRATLRYSDRVRGTTGANDPAATEECVPGRLHSQSTPLTPYYLHHVMKQIIQTGPGPGLEAGRARIALARQLLRDIARARDDGCCKFAPLGLATGIAGIAMLGMSPRTADLLDHLILHPMRLRPDSCSAGSRQEALRPRRGFSP